MNEMTIKQTVLFYRLKPNIIILNFSGPISYFRFLEFKILRQQNFKSKRKSQHLILMYKT